MDINIESQLVIQTEAQWASDTTVYSEKRILVSSDATYTGTDQRKIKIPNGVDTWSNLDYFPAGSSGLSGTTNKLAKFTSSTTIGDSQVFDNGTNVGIGTILPTAKLSISTNGNDNTTFAIDAKNSSGFNLIKMYDSGHVEYGYDLDMREFRFGPGGGRIITSLTTNMLVAQVDLFNARLSNSFNANNQDITAIGKLGVGVGIVETSAVAEFFSFTKGILTPRTTTALINAIASPATGLFIYDTDLNVFKYYNGTSWLSLLKSDITININGKTSLLSSSPEFRTAQASTGALSYAGTTIASATTVNIGSVTGYVVNNESNPSLPTFTRIDYPGETGKTVTTIGTGIITYILLQPDGLGGGTIVFQNTYPTSAQRKTMIYLSKLSHPNSVSLAFGADEVDFMTSPVSQFRDLFQSFNYINRDVYPSANGANLNFNLSAGTITGDGINFVTDNTNPNTFQVPSQTPASFIYRNQNGGTSGFVSLIDPTNYDNAGVTTAVGGGVNSSTIQYIFYVPPLGLIVQRGQFVYSSLADAIANIGKESFVLFPNLVRNSILIGVLAVKRSATALNNTDDAQFFRADILGQIIGSAGGTSTGTLQSAYNNSADPEILTDSTRDGFTVRRGSASDTDNIYVGQNGAGTTTFAIDGNGKATLSNPINEAKGANIASSATTDIGAATGNLVHVTGTTTITSFGTVQAGTRRVVVFDSSLTITHNSTSLILPGGNSIITTAGQSITFVSEGSGNWRMIGNGGLVASTFRHVTSDQATTLATAVAITDLVFSVEANKKYVVRGFLHIGCDGSGGFKTGVTTPSATTIFIEQSSRIATNDTQRYSAISASGALSSQMSTVASTGGFIFIEGIITTTNSGTFQYNFASNTAGQTSTIFADGSYLELIPLT